MSKPHRATIFVDEAEVLATHRLAGEQCVLKVRAPRIARDAKPGSFAHLTCDPALPMRRPLSIMRVDRDTGEVDFLYKILGTGTKLLADRKPGERLSVMGPIGNPFVAHPDRPRTLLLGGGVGIPPMVFLASELRLAKTYKPFVIMGSEVPFPFTPKPSRFIVPGMPEAVIAAMPLMEDWDIPSRLTSRQGYPGCHDGYVTDLARLYLQTLEAEALKEVELFACGPHPMLEACARVAREFGVPCQVSLEEFMACGVGGCAGCAVQVQTPSGPAMKRVCVDGPVFEAGVVFP